MRSTLALLLALALSACGGDPHEGHGAVYPSADAPAEASGNPDLAFIDGMVPHHEGALDMARLAADRAGSPEVRALAQTITESQAAEIDTLRAWRARWFPDAPAASGGMTHGGMNHAEMDTRALEAASGEAFDRLFLAQMIGHHAEAIPMSAHAHARTARPQVRALASRIVRDQAREIGQMQALLDARAPATAATTPGTASTPDVPPAAEPAVAPTASAPAPATAPASAPTPRTVAVGVTADGFEPARFELPAGVASRIVFTRTSEATCATSVRSPALGLAETPLPLGQAVSVEVRPQRAGEFAFACGMDMVSGVIVAQ